MLSISVVADEKYYSQMASPDRATEYYLSETGMQGHWYGRGAEALGLHGVVEPETFTLTLNGHNPINGMPMVQNAGRDDRRKGFDFTFGLDKSVDTVFAVWDPSRRTILQCQDEAVRSTLSFLEAEAGRTRRGKGGHEIQQAGLVWAVFHHLTSRANDPHIHTHCVLANVGVRQDGTTGTLLTTPFFTMKMTLGALYRAEFSRLVQERLNLRVRREQSWFELEGVPRSACRALSTRRKELESELGAPKASARASERAALATRRPKNNRPLSELTEIWIDTAQKHGFGPAQAAELMSRAATQVQEDQCGSTLPLNQADLIDEALHQLTSKQSHFSEMELIRFIAEASQTTMLGLKGVVDLARKSLQTNPHLVKLGTDRGIVRYSTDEMVAIERRMLDTVNQSRTDATHVVSAASVDAVLRTRPELTREQRIAIRALTQESGSIRALSGLAGTGKTLLLDTCRECWERAGFTVRGAALSGKAAREIQNKAAIPSETLHRVLKQIEAGRPIVVRGSVLVVDEASMIGTRQMAVLVEAVQRGGGKLILAGDPRQLQALEAGGPFNSVIHRHGAAELKGIRRQNSPWARAAVRDFSQGEAGKAIRAYAERGHIHVAKTRRKAMDDLIKAWGARPLSDRHETLILAATRAEATELNRRAQAVRQEKGEITAPGLIVDSDVFFPGDRILFTRNSRLYDVHNGTLGTVESVEIGRVKVLSIRLDNGRKLTLSPEQYPHLKLGYALTTHKAQGATVAQSFVLAGGSMQDLHLAYVQASRASGDTHFFVDRSEAGEGLTDLIKSMSRSRVKNLASDIQDGNPPSQSPPSNAVAEPVTEYRPASPQRDRGR